MYTVSWSITGIIIVIQWVFVSDFQQGCGFLLVLRFLIQPTISLEMPVPSQKHTYSCIKYTSPQLDWKLPDKLTYSCMKYTSPQLDWKLPDKLTYSCIKYTSPQLDWKLNTNNSQLYFLCTLYKCRFLIQPTISLEMPVPSQGHYGFHSFPVVDWFCLFIYLWVLTFLLEDCSEFGNFVITLYWNKIGKIVDKAVPNSIRRVEHLSWTISINNPESPEVF
jgi:hypothetical protein